MKTKQQRGWLSIELSITLAAIASLSAIGWSYFHEVATNYVKRAELSSFIEESFVRSDDYFHEFANQTSCYNAAPPQLTFAEMVNSHDLIDSTDAWFVPQQTLYSYERASSGRVNRAVVSILLNPEIEATVYSNQHHFFGFEGVDRAVYKQRINLDIDESNWLYLDSSWCE